MSKKLLYLTSFVLVLALAGTNVAFGQVVWEGRVSSSFDDLEEFVSSGNYDNTSSDLEITEEGSPGSNQLIGVRFNNVRVPQGATITNAYVQFTVDEISIPGDNRPGTKFLRGEAVDNAAIFSISAPFNISSRPTTSAEASWDWPFWTTVGEAGPDQQTSDISAVIEEIVGRPGWSPGNSLVLIITGSGENTAEAFDGDSAAAALLHVEYTLGKAARPSPADGTIDVPRDVVLSWKPGIFAMSINGHKVYFSESFNDVNDGIGAITQSVSSYTPPQRLDFSTTYYWRVDEVNNVNPDSPWISNVWSFTTELFAYPIDGNNITATASSTGQPGMDPENTINGSGLDVNDLHSTEAIDMWISDSEPNGAWIEYELDKVHKLHEMWVWNSNQTIESIIGFGPNDVTIEYSTNGTDYTTLGTTHEFARGPGTPDYAHNTTVDFGGTAAKYVRLTANSNWGGVLDKYGLSEVRFFHIPVHAEEPSPDSGATDVAVDVTLGFRAGREAVTHDVYLSTDEQAVIDGNVPVSTVTETSYGPLSLDLGTTYYWKINEVNDAETPATWESDLWSFTTTDHIIVDGFEGYNDYPPDEIWNTWIDGYGVPANGATVGYPAPNWGAGEHYVETAIVHGGDQSMPFFYDNTGVAAYSEGERTFAVPQDWTAANVQTLALHFHGTVGNTGQLYVKINGTKVPYDGQASNLALTGWQAWNIDLASFGAGLQSVTTLAIGIDGNGASGTFYFDDIGLYARGREFITPVAPSSAGLIGHWKLDEGTGTIAFDSSGLGNDGTLGGDPQWVAGIKGGALDLDGIDDYVAIDGIADDITTNTFTVSAWIKTTQTGDGNVIGSNSGGSHDFVFGVDQGFLLVESNSLNLYPPAINDDQWHMITYVRDGSTAYAYVDGALRGTEIATGNPAAETRWSIGQEWDSSDSSDPSDEFDGTVDDVRFYNYALSPAEVAWLTGRTEPFDKPF
ncbi:MAG: discoidin domain-containing protein [Planctomycetes bacterium]|nr:discoidin domain-containing protein [Planctomycetota bacterium]